MLDVRTYTRDGAVIAGFQFAADAQFLPYRDGRFLLVARGVTGAFSATAIDPDLVGGTRLYSAAASATEHMLGARPLATSTIVITDEHFVNVGSGRAVAWSPSSAPPTAQPSNPAVCTASRPQADRVLIAWGTNDVLRLAVLDAVGRPGGARRRQTGFFDSSAATRRPRSRGDTGLLLFDGNGVRLTQIGFDLSRTGPRRRTSSCAPSIAPRPASPRSRCRVGRSRSG